jgi:GNAT superfamily N-acetyltransferase
MIIENARQKDLEQIYKLGRGEKYFSVNEDDPGFWSLKILNDWFNSENGIMIVAKKDNKIISFALANFIPEIKQVIFQNLYTEAEYRKSGIAEMLIDFLIEESQKKDANYICGMTDIHNEAMLQLFAKADFDKGHAHFWMSKNI